MSPRRLLPIGRRLRVLVLLAFLSVPAIGATLTFTLPSFNADTTGCGAGQIPLDDLESVYVYGQPRYSTHERLIACARVAGREGAVCGFVVGEDTMQTVWVVTTDHAHNRSCPSNYTQVAGRAGVGTRPALPPIPQVYDVAGRHVLPPYRPGIYLTRDAHGRLGRIVVIR